MRRAMDVLRPADLPGISAILAGREPERHVPEWRVRAFAALAPIPEELSSSVLEWALVETLGNWSIQRQPCPRALQETGTAVGLRGSGRWQASDGGGHWGLLAAALADSEAARAEVFFSSDEWTAQKAILAQEQRRKDALYRAWGGRAGDLVRHAEKICERGKDVREFAESLGREEVRG